MEPEKKSNGAMIGLIVIIVILIVGGIYLWRTRMKETQPNDTSSLNSINNEANALDTEVNNMDVDSLDSEI